MKLWKIVPLYGWQLLNRMWIMQTTVFIQTAVWNYLKHITLLSYHPAIIIIAESLIQIFSKQSMLWVWKCPTDEQCAKPRHNHFTGFIKPLRSLSSGHASIWPGIVRTAQHLQYNLSHYCHITTVIWSVADTLWGTKSLFSRVQRQDIKSKPRRWHYISVRIKWLLK